MEKLIELLNEWYQERYKTNPHFNKFEDYGGNDYGYFTGDDNLMVETEVRTKKYGFIKWLVDNDKIDRLTFCTVETPSSKYEDFDLGPETPREDYTNILLMDLAIQDNPIEFLISILK